MKNLDPNKLIHLRFHLKRKWKQQKGSHIFVQNITTRDLKEDLKLEATLIRKNVVNVNYVLKFVRAIF